MLMLGMVRFMVQLQLGFRVRVMVLFRLELGFV